MSVYNRATSGFLACTLNNKCLNQQDGLQSVIDGVPTVLEIQYEGFAWSSADYCKFQLVRPYKTDLCKKVCCGLGVPMLGFHNRSRADYFDCEVPFAATAIVVPSSDDGSLALHMINPIASREFSCSNAPGIAGCSMPLSYDMTAAWANVEANHSQRETLLGFLRPDASGEESGLVMLHPHEKGRIPVVFVHGLASDPMTWLAMVNELQVDSDIRQRYEFWAFHYPTGNPFPLEAAKLRLQLRDIRARCDTTDPDPALDRMVVIGHSMGGLVTKIMITHSGKAIERSLQISDAELNSLPPTARDAIVWDPVESIERVIFMATPHHGSSLASRPLGRFASRLVRLDGSPIAAFGDLINDGRNRLSRGYRRIPTSVDMLRPSDPTLCALARLPITPRVTAHSIIGCGHNCCLSPDSDGVVPVTSARIPGVESELLVDSGHSVQQTPEALAEVKRILHLHASQPPYAYQEAYSTYQSDSQSPTESNLTLTLPIPTEQGLSMEQETPASQPSSSWAVLPELPTIGLDSDRLIDSSLLDAPELPIGSAIDGWETLPLSP